MESTMPSPPPNTVALGGRTVAGTSVRILFSQDPADLDRDTTTVIKEQPADPKLKPPPMYKVILLNDDYTPQEFVVRFLMRFFYMDIEKAWRLMWTVHTTGSSVVGIYPRDIAETKSEQVNAYAQENNHPLKSAVEQTDAD